MTVRDLGPAPDPSADPELAEHLFGEVSERPPAPKVRVARQRREVQMGPDLRRVVDECIDAIATDPRTFCRANELVTIIGAPPDMARTPLARGTPIIRPLAAATLLERLTDVARVLKYSRKEEKWVELLAPPPVVNAMIARGDWQGVRSLAGVVETPLFRPDGTVRQERGYDAATGYVVLPNADYPAIPESPTHAEAKRALNDLADAFADFPYVDESHRMVPIAAILTMLARAAIAGSVPAFLFDASTRGSGKTLQADVVHLIAFGRSAARKNYPEDDDELEKVLSSYAIAGARCILLDNVTRPIGGGPIDLCITARDDVELRVLGASEMRRLPWQAVILMSGNNLVLGDDTVRRVLVARIESSLENPEERVDFRHHDLVGHVRAERPRLVAAALTVLRAYAAKGFPDAGCPRWGSFEAWSRLVPHAIVFAGGADPMGARPRADGALTDDLMALGVVLRELPRLAPDGATARALLSLLYADRDPHDGPDGWETLREAIEVWCPSRAGARPDAQRLGKALRRYHGRVLGGRRLRSRPAGGGLMAWHVVGA